MRVVCISDTHGLHETLQENVDIPEGDLLIHAGDFTDTGDLQEVMSALRYLARKVTYDQFDSAKIRW